MISEFRAPRPGQPDVERKPAEHVGDVCLGARRQALEDGGMHGGQGDGDHSE
jgi:hypothetical protein